MEDRIIRVLREKEVPAVSISGIIFFKMDNKLYSLFIYRGIVNIRWDEDGGYGSDSFEEDDLATDEELYESILCHRESYGGAANGSGGVLML